MSRTKLGIGILVTTLALAFAAWLLVPDRSADGKAEIGEHTSTNTEASASKKTPRSQARPEFEGAAKAAITGTVRDVQGQPIAGAQVCTWVYRDDLEGLPVTPPRCVKTEADGHYRLEGLLPVRAQLSAEARGYLPEGYVERHPDHRKTALALSPGQTREGVDFVLREGGVAVSGVVRDISGGVVEGASVWAANGNWMAMGRSVTITDADGRFEVWVEPGSVRVHADADGYAPSQRSGAAPSAKLEVVLTPESIIVGRVVLAGSDEPVAGVVVDAGGAGFFDGDGRARTDDDGRFKIAKLQPGIYDLSARADELFGEAPEQTHVGLAETSEEVVIELHPAHMVTGLVTYAGVDGRPCPSGSVNLTDVKDPDEDHFTEIRDGGEVEIHALMPGTYKVQVQCEGAVSESEYPEVVIADASVSGLVWEVREGLAIAGEVVDANGQPIPGARVYAQMQTKADDPRAQQTRQMSQETLPDGEFRVGGLLPGSYELSAFAEGFSRRPEPVTVELEAGSDRHDVRIEMPAEGVVTGVVRDTRGEGISGVTVRASGLDKRSWASAMTDDEGRFTLDHVPPGEARVSASEGWSAPLRTPGTTADDPQGEVVQVVANETVEVVLTVESRTARITGRVLDESGAPVTDAFVSHRRVNDSAATSQGSSKRSLRWGFEDRPVLTDVDGKFTIEGLSDEATYAIGAFRKGGGEALVDGVRPGDSVELTLVETGEIAGKLVIDGGPAPERAKLTLIEPNEGLRRSDDLFRTGGKFRFKELPPGTYQLVVDSPAGSAQLDGIVLEAGGAVTDLVVTLSPRVTVRGRLVDLETREPVPGLVVSVSARKAGFRFSMDESANDNVSDTDGRFEVTDAQTGKVRMMARPRSFTNEDRYGWTSISLVLPADQDVVDVGDIELIARRTEGREKGGDLGFTLTQSAPDADDEDFVASVAVVRPGGPAEAAGLAVGDVIETVDGHDIKGTNRYRFSTLTSVPPGTRVTLGLEGKPEVTITAGKPIE